MIIIKTLIAFISISTLHAEVFTSHQSKKIEIVTLDGMKVSESCAKNKKDCWAFFDPKKIKAYTVTQLKGNPASSFCNENNGVAVTFKDSKSNEYAFCQFEKDYYVDGWDFYKRFNK